MFSFQHRDACPTCGSVQFSTLYDQPFSSEEVRGFLEKYYARRLDVARLSSGRYVLCECAQCETIFQRDILDSAGMEELYEHSISASESLAKRETAGRDYFQKLLSQAGEISTVIDEGGRPPREVRVLDFGMGWGHWAFAAHALGYSVKGSELSAQRTAYAAARGIDNVLLDDLEPASLDFINTEQVFEHLPEPQIILAALVRALKPGGVLRISVPDGSTVSQRLRAGKWVIGKNQLHPLEHINCYRSKSLDHLAGSYGLQRMGPRSQPSSTRPRSSLKVGLSRLLRRSSPKPNPNVPSGYFRKSIVSTSTSAP